MKIARIAIKSGFVVPAIVGPLSIIDLFTGFPFAAYWYLDLSLLFASIVIPYLAWDAWNDCIREPLFAAAKPEPQYVARQHITRRQIKHQPRKSQRKSRESVA